MPVFESPVARVIIVVLDGLRADAIPLFELPQFGRLAARGHATLAASTVSPSVTAAAMASLLTGAAPERHGLTSDRFRIPRPRAPLDPLPRLLRRYAIPTFTYMARLPFGYGRVASRIAQVAGVDQATFRGDDASGILASSRGALRREGRGLFVFHWPDADRAGHATGSTSPAYRAATTRLDDALGMLDTLTGASRDPETLLIALADHGGGGRVARDHDSPHCHDRRIPLLLAGGRVRFGTFGACSLLDVPATACWALGIPVPTSYQGRPLTEAFVRRRSSPASPPARQLMNEEALCSS